MMNSFRLALFLTVTSVVFGEEPAARPTGTIADKEIAALQAELAEAGKASLATAKRRACKGVIRDGEALIEANPTDPNRFRVLGIVFRARQQLFALESDDRNRKALLETSRELAKAPDEHAEMRLEADLLLSEAELSGRNATVAERARALEELLGRYRGTPAEVKSLKIAAGIAPKLEAFELATRIQRTMLERFGDDFEVIEYLRRSSNIGRMDVLFSGTFERVDGTTLSFPIDRSGHLSVIVFWSRETQGYEEALAKIGENRQLYPGKLDFFSFNIDELPDAGEATLRSLNLDWTVMRLPGGRNSQTFRTYGLGDPVGILVNAYGRIMLTIKANNSGHDLPAPVTSHQIHDARISDERYLAQLQSLFIGDFLADDPGTQGADGAKPPGSVPAEELRAIQDCFVPAPFRYRLKRAEALANYEKAAQLCDQVIARHPDAPDLWQVRERRIIALLGRWNLAAEPKFLEQAANEARAMLAASPPQGAGVVPRFCLAKEALRKDHKNVASLFSTMIDDLGGSEAPGTALAAAAILALDANSRDLHERYRTLLLDRHAEEPALWPVLAFLRDRYHTLYLLRANFIRREDVDKPARDHVVNHGLEAMTRPLPKIELKTLDGATLRLPQDSADKLTLLMFVEPPPDPAADFSGDMDSQGRPTGQDSLRMAMGYAFERAQLHIHKEVEVIAAFLCDDAERVRGLMAKNAWPCRAVMVPGGLKNPLVRQLGILSADRIPNVFLLRRDGTIAWHTSGFNSKADYGYPFSIRLAMKLHIEICDAEFAYRALEKGDFEKAKRVFSGPFLPERDERYLWQGPRSHGRALANIGLKDWAAALADIDAAIETHRREFPRGSDGPCESMLAMQRARALILENLGRQDEAKAAREAAAVQPAACPDAPYDTFHRKLGKLPVVRN